MVGILRIVRPPVIPGPAIGPLTSVMGAPMTSLLAGPGFPPEPGSRGGPRRGEGFPLSFPGPDP